ncbi:MAG: B12-binding domain-containing radical SAM protein [Halodesulfurarchaeum sp.]
MADVLLVNAPAARVGSDAHASLNPPLGLAYIGGILRENGFGVEAVDFNISGLSEQRLQATLSRVEPRIVGISAHTETYPKALEIASIVKRTVPEAVVVLGGAHPSVTYETTARESAVDYVVVGEGDRTMLELAERIASGTRPTDIKGVAFETETGVKFTGRRPFIEDPNTLPPPARDLFPLHLYQSPGNLLFSRGGCPFNCHFCAVNSIWEEGGRRFHSPDRVIEEIRELVEGYGIDHVNFADDVFTLHRQKTEALLDRLATVELAQPWSFTCATRVDLVDEELLRRLAEVGCTGIQFGVEAGSQEILETIGKGISTEEIRKTVQQAVDAGLDVLASFMFPHPADTESTIRSQIEFMNELHELGADLSLAYTTPYPGTGYRKLVEKGVIEAEASGWGDYDAKHLMISTQTLSIDELEPLRDELLEETGLARRKAMPQ